MNGDIYTIPMKHVCAKIYADDILTMIYHICRCKFQYPQNLCDNFNQYMCCVIFGLLPRKMKKEHFVSDRQTDGHTLHILSPSAIFRAVFLAPTGAQEVLMLVRPKFV